jgi:hypothetical protein
MRNFPVPSKRFHSRIAFGLLPIGLSLWTGMNISTNEHFPIWYFTWLAGCMAPAWSMHRMTQADKINFYRTLGILFAVTPKFCSRDL